MQLVFGYNRHYVESAADWSWEIRDGNGQIVEPAGNKYVSNTNRSLVLSRMLGKKHCGDLISFPAVVLIEWGCDTEGPQLYWCNAVLAELADALALGAGGRKAVQLQVLAPFAQLSNLLLIIVWPKSLAIASFMMARR